MTLRRILTATLCAGLVLVSAPAQAHEPTFTVTPTAVTLLNGTFSDNGHLNVRTNLRSWNVHFEGKCTNRDDHECAGQRHADAQFIGKSVYPLVLRGGECVEWIQHHRDNYHFDVDNGDAPVCSPTATPTDLPTEPPVDNPTDEPTEDPTEDPTWTETPDPTPEPTITAPDPGTTTTPTDPPTWEPSPPTSPTETPTDQPGPSTPPSSEPSVDPSPSTDPVAPLEPTPSPTSSSPTTTSPGTSQPSVPMLNASPPASEQVAPSPTSATPAMTDTGTSCADYATPIRTLDRNLDADGDGIGCEDNLAATGSSLVGKVVTTSVLLLVGGALVYGSIIRRKAAK